MTIFYYRCQHCDSEYVYTNMDDDTIPNTIKCDFCGKMIVTRHYRSLDE